ncbi:MAG TPA: hypothetical protein PKD67_05790 [Ignavibacteriaceae bacterium]|nr:hypothetical protein [Ignavibacteriaceae bacterium]
MEEELTEIYDRFSFDKLFRSLLTEEYDAEEALSYILNNCKLSALVFQERIYNKYYRRISIDETMSDDLKKLRQEIFNKIFQNKN